jgi:hypothetical protein
MLEGVRHAVIAAAAALLVPQSAPAQMLPTRPLAGLAPIKVTAARHTRFDPAVHGFKFANTFANNMLSQFDVRTDGLCGGMVYAALDYYNAERPIPQPNYEPTEGTALRQYIYRRQVESLASNLDKWAELTINPFGTRNEEFYRWGLDGKPGGRIDELRRAIDSGRPVALGLKGCNEGCKGDHQVLAIGYDMGGYQGDFGARLGRFKIFIYDPNFPGQTMTLMAYPEADQFRYEEADHRGDRHRWRSWFVNANYNADQPPDVALAPKELVLELNTGGDDLRGGNDNLHVVALLRDGRELRFDNVNNRRRWVNNSWQTVALPLPDGVAGSDVRGVRLETTFGGGMGGDNWNLDKIIVWSRSEGGRSTLFQSEGGPLFRFTGDRKVQEFAF